MVLFSFSVGDSKILGLGCSRPTVTHLRLQTSMLGIQVVLKEIVLPEFARGCPPASIRAHSLQPGEGQSRFVISFVFRALLVDSSGSCAPLYASRSRRWPAVFLPCSLPTVRAGVHVRGPPSGRSVAHRVCPSSFQSTTSVTSTGVSFTSCWRSSWRRLEGRRSFTGVKQSQQTVSGFQLCGPPVPPFCFLPGPDLYRQRQE